MPTRSLPVESGGAASVQLAPAQAGMAPTTLNRPGARNV